MEQSAECSGAPRNTANNQQRPKSDLRGLSWDRKHEGWRVRIYYQGKQRHIGRFSDEIEAAKAYDAAAYYLYGDSAITNFGLESCRAGNIEAAKGEELMQPSECKEQQHIRSPSGGDFESAGQQLHRSGKAAGSSLQPPWQPETRQQAGVCSGTAAAV
ncbi:hypothetical protein OEZ86_002192 [Tetradesmus obliquus]|nr:hypothetical protein OEZ86_002192 [Tetradesmus obliquus]